MADIFPYFNEMKQEREFDGYTIFDNSGYPDISYNLKTEERSSVSSDGSVSTDESSALVPCSQFIEEPSESSLEITDLSVKSADEVPKQCVVCLEPTKCYHYDVPSCTGCKTFFRRCLITGKRYKCQFGGKCEITRGEDCRGCRFERCLISGMNAAAIQYPTGIDVNKIVENVKQLKRKLIEDNRPVVSKMLPTYSETEERRDIDFLLYLEAKQRKLRESDYDPQYLYALNLRDILERTSELSLADKYEKPPNWPIDLSKFIEKVQNCQRNREKGICIKSCGNNGEKQKCKKLFMAVDVILTIEMAKILPIFNYLSLNDREVLMRHVVIVNMLLTQGFYSYQQHLDVIIFPNGIIPIKVDQELGRGNQLKYETHRRTVECLSRVALEPEHFVLLKAIIYCHPAVEGLSNEAREIIDRFHQKYSRILLRHLQNTLGGVAGASKFGEIISLISTYFHFAEKAKQVHLLQVIQMHPNRRDHKIKHRLLNECMQ
ncbi:hypothetical protein FO519_006078 [Halicephalobus sp. NKZ332]|nr:hypothetical protein FO519_006078 [Halicephalobus sp. NKZ332]